MDLGFQIGNLQKSVIFAIVDSFAVPLFAGRAYQGKLFEAIQCKGYRLFSVNSRAISILETLAT